MRQLSAPPSLRSHTVGMGEGALAIAVVSGLVYALKPVAPVLSLGVLYVVAVVVVAIRRGLLAAIATSIGSMLAFNFLFLPPIHTFALRDSSNWVALAVYLATAVVVSELATRSRRRANEAEQRRQEAAFVAQTSGQLLEADSVESSLKQLAAATGELLGLGRARIELGSRRRAEKGEVGFDLVAAGRHTGRLFADNGPADGARLDRVLPALASLLAVAADRERLARAAFDAETLRRSDAIKTAVLRSVSHDLRSPLTAIRAAAEGLSATLGDADRHELLSAIGAEVARLERLVTNLIDLSRLEAGAATPHPEVWSVDELVARALDGADAPESLIDVRLSPDPLATLVDAAHVERALVNLIDNACKFAPTGTQVEISATARDDSVVITIRDSGPGLGPGEAERLFEPFAIGRGGRTHGGTGLGLAIARGFAEANGGRITAGSASGGGAVFELALPRVHVPAEVRA